MIHLTDSLFYEINKNFCICNKGNTRTIMAEYLSIAIYLMLTSDFIFHRIPHQRNEPVKYVIINGWYFFFLCRYFRLNGQIFVSCDKYSLWIVFSIRWNNIVYCFLNITLMFLILTTVAYALGTNVYIYTIFTKMLKFALTLDCYPGKTYVFAVVVP